MDMCAIREAVCQIEGNRVIQDELFAEAYDHVVQLSCPRLPRDCQIEITRMLSPAPLPLSLLRNGHHHNQKGFIVRLLPEAKKINRQATDPYDMIDDISSTEELFYELRESFSIDFDFSHLSNIDSNQLLYLVSAFGSVQNYETFITLSSLRLNVDFQTYHQQAIYIAFKYANINLITYFLKYIKIYEKDVDADLPSILLGFAAEFGLVSIVREIMKNFKCDPAFDNNYAIRWSAQAGHLDVVKYLMEEVDSKYGINPADCGNWAIRCSATNGHMDVVKYLMEEVDSKYEIDPAAEDNYAIRWSASNGHLDVVKHLLEEVDSKYGIDPAASNNFAIRWSAQEGHLDVVKYLLEEGDSKYGIDPAALNNNAIQCAASRGNLDVVKYLWEEVDSKYEIDPAAEDNFAIRWSASNGRLDVVKYLLEEVDTKYGIDPAAQNNEAIRCSAQEIRLDVVKYLMGLDSKYGIDRSIGEAFLYPERSSPS